MRVSTRQLLTLGLVGLCTVMLAGLHVADGSPPSKPVIKAKLTPCCGDLEPDAQGQVLHKTQTKRGELQRLQFQGVLSIPIPSTGLGIPDETAAAEADMRVVLSHDGTPYAECQLDFVGLEAEEDEGNRAVYQVNVMLQFKKGTPVLREVIGTCDTDLVTPDIQPGVPAVQAGDLATVLIGTEGGEIDFLQGTFK